MFALLLFDMRSPRKQLVARRFCVSLLLLLPSLVVVVANCVPWCIGERLFPYAFSETAISNLRIPQVTDPSHKSQMIVVVVVVVVVVGLKVVVVVVVAVTVVVVLLLLLPLLLLLLHYYYH